MFDNSMGFHRSAPQMNGVTPEMLQQRHDWRDALNVWRDQRPTHQSVFPDFTGQPTDAMRTQFQTAMDTWQSGMPQMPASLSALMPQGAPGMPQGQQGFISGPPANPLTNPPVSSPL